VRTAALLSLFALAACGDVGTAERLSSKETLDGIDVPTIGTVGDFPDPAHRIVVNVTRDGRILIDGRPLSFRELEIELEECARRSSDVIDDVDGARTISDEAVVLRVDSETSWDATICLIEACAHARVWRVFFVVRDQDGHAEGAFKLYVSPDAWRSAKELDRRRGENWLGPSIMALGNGTEPSLMYDFLARGAGIDARWQFAFSDPMRTDSALTLLGVAARAGAQVEVIQTRRPRQDSVAAAYERAASNVAPKSSYAATYRLPATNGRRRGTAGLSGIVVSPPEPDDDGR